MNIIVPRKKLQAFRRECRAAFPNEVIAVLRGSRNETGVEIQDIVPIRHVGDPDKIDVKGADIRNTKISALFMGAEFLGTIHSHCYVPEDPCCWHLSKTDIKSALKDGETVCGLVYVYDAGKRSDVHWYLPHPIPTVEYSD
jgi:hypothetical protein